MIELPAAVISEDGLYRYFLSRTWANTGKKIAFIGLNPSTADATNDDPTIRRCVQFAKDWGGTSLLMVNLFAYRATKPSVLLDVSDPIGPDNDKWLEKVIRSADIVIAAWGNHGSLLNRSAAVIERYEDKLQALNMTKMGMPGHPLYIAGTTLPKPYVEFVSQNLKA
jgi:hypothetical protein